MEISHSFAARFNDENTCPSGGSPTKVKKVLLPDDEPSSPKKTPKKEMPNVVSPLRKLSVGKQDGKPRL